MLENKEEYKDVDRMLERLFPGSLEVAFENRLSSRGISLRQAEEILGIDRRSLSKVLKGQATRIDGTILIKLSKFLDISKEDLVELFMDAISDQPNEDIDQFERRKFIADNFDLSLLKKYGIIQGVSDFASIESDIKNYFGLSSIYEYSNVNNAVFSSSKLTKDQSSIELWLNKAKTVLREINNPYPFNVRGLIDFFPTIRWHSTNDKKGIYQVSRSLYKFGVTLIFEPKIEKLGIRGATIPVNNKPCIILTNITEFYPTLWFTLLHELYHVIIEWDEIIASHGHISNEDDEGSVRESKADKFARDYLFSDNKLETAKNHIKDEAYIFNIAKELYLHPSIIYAFYCFDEGKMNKKVWGKYRKLMPEISDLNDPLIMAWREEKNLLEIAQNIKETVFKLA